MTETTSRRDQICRAAVALASRGGSHALTHQGIDRELGISRGSTSYYYRTRAALIGAVAHHLAAESRSVFESLLATAQSVDPAALIDDYLLQLTTGRREHVRARLALALDADCGPEQAAALAGCLFSRDAAIELFSSDGSPDPAAEATRMLDELEGRLLRETVFSQVR